MSGKRGMTKLVLGGMAIVAGLGGLVAVALSGSTVSTVAFADVTTARDRVEIYGVLDKRSIRPIRGANVVQFELLEEENDGKEKRLTGRRLSVLYENSAVGLPANFPAASHARAAGVFDPSANRLVSNQVYTKCPSKYEEDGLDPATKTALKQWKDATVPDNAESSAAPGAGALKLPIATTVAQRP